MAIKQFKAESQKLLDLMINSIYTNKEIFLRELISNASDALDKLRFKSLTDDSVGLNTSDFAITLTPDKETRTLKISDNGIGMTKDELENNLGTIARSGSLDFKKENTAEDIDIIGQFGVGFYSAFMVASRVSVVSRAFGSDEAWKWESSGAEGYTIEPAEKEAAGTDITLYIKDNTETENYDRFVDEYGLQSLVKKYSDYIRYPIQMMMTHSHPIPKPEDAGEDWKQEYEEHQRAAYRKFDEIVAEYPQVHKKLNDMVSDLNASSSYEYEAAFQVGFLLRGELTRLQRSYEGLFE